MRLNFARPFAAPIACLLAACTTSASSANGTPPAVVGADRDAHQCIASAGYSWCESTQRCERPWELAGQKGFTLSEANFAHYCSTGTAN
jgi:hypothetical protein